jgi:phosphotransferase system enzyme I (PtsI)
MTTLAGIATSRGLVSGPVFLYRGDGEIPVPEYVVEAGREEEELRRFDRAVADTKRDLESLISVLRERTGRADVRVFECHLMFLEDPTLEEAVRQSVTVDHINVEAAVKAFVSKMRAQFARMNDAYFRERVRDFDDVERRLLGALTGFAQDPHRELKVPSIIVADDLTPSETVRLPRENVLGFATNGGSATSHVALLARAMAIPAVTGLVNVTSQVKPGTTVILDGSNGTITINPDRQTVELMESVLSHRKAAEQTDADGAPAGTLREGGDILLFANIHPGVAVSGLKEIGARGVGLYRSEYLWLNREREPTEEEQFEAYREAVVEASKLSPQASITIRALDIGGDKTVKGISAKENNPFLGNRSIRYLLSNVEVFKTQLRAVLRASAYGRTYLMYPMVSCVEELNEAAVVLADVKRKLDENGIPYDRQMPVGAMIEIPAAAINADAMAQRVDFFSIGTNDLIQYTMAADRSNEAVAHLYQPTNPAILYLMKRTIAAAHRHGIKVGVCGESASDPIVGVLWAALGIDMLSMSGTYIPVMAKLFRRLTRSDLDDYAKLVDGMDDSSTAQDIFESCREWMERKIPDIDDLMI